MRSVNKVILIGNVTRDPELRQTQSGQAVCTFGLATNREWVTSDSRKKSSAEYHEVVAWAQLADICSKYVRKGKLLYVEGYLKTRSWDTPEGIRKFKTEVVIQDMIMLEKRKDGEGYDETASYTDTSEGYYDDSSSSTETPAEETATEETATEETTTEEATTEEPAAEVEAPAEEPAEPTAGAGDDDDASDDDEEEKEEEKKEESLIDADFGL
jgi:single-strand DNA-binding protein